MKPLTNLIYLPQILGEEERCGGNERKFIPVTDPNPVPVVQIRLKIIILSLLHHIICIDRLRCFCFIFFFYKNLILCIVLVARTFTPGLDPAVPIGLYRVTSPYHRHPDTNPCTEEMGVLPVPWERDLLSHLFLLLVILSMQIKVLMVSYFTIHSVYTLLILSCVDVETPSPLPLPVSLCSSLISSPLPYQLRSHFPL